MSVTASSPLTFGPDPVISGGGSPRVGRNAHLEVIAVGVHPRGWSLRPAIVYKLYGRPGAPCGPGVLRQ